VEIAIVMPTEVEHQKGEEWFEREGEDNHSNNRSYYTQ
jgi:hypothetical protein